MTRLFPLLLLSSRVLAAVDTGYELWWQSNTTEVAQLEPLKLSGHGLPAWLNGMLVRTGPGQFEAGGVSVHHQFDGLAKLSKFSIRAGRVSFQTRFLGSALRNVTIQQGRLPPYLTMCAMTPELDLRQRLEALTRTNDINNIFLWRTGEHFFATSDATTATNEFDPISLSPLGHTRVEGEIYAFWG